MTALVAEMTVSVDGYIAGPEDDVGQPFGGRDASRLHNWYFSGREPYAANSFFRPEGRNVEVVDDLFATIGAVLTGRRTYDLVKGWGGNHPIPGLPIVVLTHTPHANPPKGRSAFTFAQDLATAVAAAKAQSGGKTVMVHGADTIRQLIDAGYLDELHLHVAPILLGAGRRLFETLTSSTPLEMIDAVVTPTATHLHYRVCHSAATAGGSESR